jgi:hypothetical protein
MAFSFMDSQPPRPRKGDQLFRGDLPDWHNNACIDVYGHLGHLPYTEGYRRGADILVQHVVNQRRDQDFLVFPIIFLYRHHLELALKRIIRRSPRLLYRDLTQEEKSHLDKHRLDLLWQDLKPMFSGICEAVGWDKKSPLFRAAVGRTKTLSERPMSRVDAWYMVRRRAKDAGLETAIGNHSFRAIGITDYLECGGDINIGKRMAGHSNVRTTELYDGRGDEVSFSEIERRGDLRSTPRRAIPPSGVKYVSEQANS